MTDYVVPPDAGPFTLVDNDTLTVTSVGSVIGTGVAAVTWDLNAGNTAPGIVIFNEGQISSTVRAIDTIGPEPRQLAGLAYQSRNDHLGQRRIPHQQQSDRRRRPC